MIELHEQWAAEENRTLDLDIVYSQIRNYVERGQLVPILCLDNGEPIACVNLLLFPDPLRAGGLIAQGDQLYVRPDYRCQRIGRLLIERGEALACWLGATEIRCCAILHKAGYYAQALPPGFKASAVVFTKEI